MTNYFISCEWMKKGFKHFLGNETGILVKAKTHKKLLKKIVHWLNETNLVSIIVKYDCDNTYIRIYKDGRFENVVGVNPVDAYFDSVIRSIASRASNASRNESTQQ